MAIVRLKNGDGLGVLTYSESKKDGPVEFRVETNHDSIRSTVNRYFTKKRKYFVPESQKLDDYREDIVVPTKMLMYFEMALTQFQNETDIQVFWPIDQDGLDEVAVTEDEGEI